MLGNETQRIGIGPQAVFVVWLMDGYTGLLGGEPAFGDGLVYVCLMDDFWYYWRVEWDVVCGIGDCNGRDFVEIDGIGGGVFEEE